MQFRVFACVLSFWYYVRALTHRPCLLTQELSNVIADDDVGADVSERQKVLAHCKCRASERAELYHLSCKRKRVPLIFLFAAHIPSSAAILFCCCFRANGYVILILLCSIFKWIMRVWKTNLRNLCTELEDAKLIY